jgi:hypothetical protein
MSSLRHEGGFSTLAETRRVNGRIEAPERVMIWVMGREPATPEPADVSATDSELQAIQAKLRRLADQLASREKLHEGEPADAGTAAKPHG